MSNEQSSQGSETNLKQEYVGAVLLVLMGVGILIAGLTYKVGTLNQMGPGFVPAFLGSLLAFIGAILGTTAFAQRNTGPGPSPSVQQAVAEWRGWCCIVGAVVAFVILGKFGGFILATLVTVFLAAIGDRSNTWRQALILSIGVTIFCVVIFWYLLSVQLPLFHWG